MEYNNDERHLTRKNQQQPAQMGSMEFVNNVEMPASVPPALSALGLGQAAVYLETHPEYLPASLHHSNWTIRAAAVQVLGKQGISVEPLLNALHDENVSVRATATRALGIQGQQAPVEPLVAALQDREWRVRTAAAQALGRLKNRTPVEPLLPVLHDENESVRAAAVWALGTLGERAPVEDLVIALQDKAWAVREAAVMALQEQGERAPIAPLLAARWDEDSSVREAVEATLSQRLNEQEGQKIVPSSSSTNRFSPSSLRLVLAVFSVGILIPLPGLLAFNLYTGRFGLASELTAVIIVCIAIALINILYQRKSTIVVSPQKHLQATGETTLWHNVVLAGVSVLTLVKIAFDILNFSFDYSMTLDMIHFILVARLIALGVMAATVIVINMAFFRRH